MKDPGGRTSAFRRRNRLAGRISSQRGARRGRKRRSDASASLAPAAAAFLLAYFYTFDSYYLPSLIRYSERDFVPPVVVFVLVGLSLAAGLVTLRRRRAGLALSVPLILACALTAFLTGAGH